VYFWKDKELAKRLHENAIPQKEQVKYFLIYCILTTLLMSATANFHAWHTAEQLSIFDYITDIVVLSVGVASVLICYRINSRGDNVDFIARWMCLSFPASIRMLAFMLILGIGAGIMIAVYEAVSLSPEELEAIMNSASEQPAFNTPEKIAWLCVLNVPMLYWLKRMLALFKIASGQA